MINSMILYCRKLMQNLIYLTLRMQAGMLAQPIENNNKKIMMNKKMDKSRVNRRKLMKQMVSDKH